MKRALSESDGFEPSSMLCVPIFNGTNDDVIGVAQLINKVGGKSSIVMKSKSKSDPSIPDCESYGSVLLCAGLTHCPQK